MHTVSTLLELPISKKSSHLVYSLCGWNSLAFVLVQCSSVVRSTIKRFEEKLMNGYKTDYEKLYLREDVTNNILFCHLYVILRYDASLTCMR